MKNHYKLIHWFRCCFNVNWKTNKKPRSIRILDEYNSFSKIDSYRIIFFSSLQIFDKFEPRSIFSYVYVCVYCSVKCRFPLEIIVSNLIESNAHMDQFWVLFFLDLNINVCVSLCIFCFLTETDTKFICLNFFYLRFIKTNIIIYWNKLISKFFFLSITFH